MNTYFITISAGIITGSFCGDMDVELAGYENHERIAVSAETCVMANDPIEFYTENWQRKTDKQLIDEGLITVPEGYVLDGDNLREMTYEEANPQPEPTAEEVAERERRDAIYQELAEAESAMRAMKEAAMPQLLALLDSQNGAESRTRGLSLKDQYENLRQQKERAEAALAV
jgi:hypothetical protein